MSWCSGCIVTGRTTSAKSVVSVRRCSSTTVKRSSRARPRRTRTWFGLLAAGFALKTTIAAIGGSAVSVSASPSRDMLTVRAGGAGRSGGETTLATGNGKWSLVSDSAPPPTCRQSPVTAGMARTARMAAPAPPCRCMPSPSRIAVGLVLGQPPAERADDVDVEPADLRRPLDGPLGEPRLELRPPDRVALEPVDVGRALVEHRAHEPQRERGIGPRQRRDVLVAAGGRLGPDRIDGDEVGPASTGLEQELPHVHVRVEGVRPPEDHELRVDHVLGVVADSGAERRVARGMGGCGAEVRVQLRGAEVAEQPRPERPALDVPHRARVVVREDRLGPVALDGALEALRREPQRLLPRDLLETALALAPDAAQRMQEAVRRVDGVEVAVDLAAQRAAVNGWSRSPAARLPVRCRPPRSATSRCPGNRAGRIRAPPWPPCGDGSRAAWGNHGSERGGTHGSPTTPSLRYTRFSR